MTAEHTELSTEQRRTDPEHQLPAAENPPTEARARNGSGHSPPKPVPGQPPEYLQKTSIGTLFKDLAADVQTLVKQEIELAKLEATRTVKRVVVDSAWIGAGVAVIAVGGLCLVLALALGLGALLDSYWLGTLITGGILFLVGALFAWKGLRDLKKGGFAPNATMDSLGEDKSWAEQEADDFKQAIRGRT